MRIKPLTNRVTYQKNPLAEVVCQVRFDQVPLGADHLASLGAELTRQGYPLLLQEEVATVSLQFGTHGVKQEKGESPQRFHHFVSKDRFWKVSLTNDFLALTCLKYQTWEGFRDRLVSIIEAARPLLGTSNSGRIGLRYRDIIDRERLGLQGRPWIELLSGFVLGPMGAVEITESGELSPEADVENLAFQTILSLDDCKVLLQGGLIHAIDSSHKAFMIDTDFFCEGDDTQSCLKSREELHLVLERLHKNAGALFRTIIREPLHDALQPSPVQ